MAFGILRCALAWIGTLRDGSYLAVWKIIDLRLETVTLLYAINTRTVNDYGIRLVKDILSLASIFLKYTKYSFQVTFFNLIRIR